MSNKRFALALALAAGAVTPELQKKFFEDAA
jgi:hypothetical protein